MSGNVAKRIAEAESMSSIVAMRKNAAKSTSGYVEKGMDATEHISCI